MGSKKPNTKGHVLYDPTCMTGADREICRDRKYVSGCRDQNEKEWGISASCGLSSRADENVFKRVMVMAVPHHECSKIPLNCI